MCAEVFVAHLGTKDKGGYDAMSSVYTEKQIGQNKVILCCFTSTGCWTAIYFSVILMGGAKEKCTAMLNFMKAKKQL